MIGVFDSGVGGLSVLGELRRLVPGADVSYLADQGRAPYGPQTLDTVRGYSEEITDHLLGEGAGMVVIACNSASAAALHHLRRRHPDVPFVGMEPAIKPATAATRSGVIGVLTTAATFQAELFASVVDRFADGVSVETVVCDGWVELVEAGVIDGPVAIRAVIPPVEELLAAGADALVLGCTHYPFLRPMIEAVAGPGVTIIDPGPAVARQAARVATELGYDQGKGRLRFETTGADAGVVELVRRLSGLEVSPLTVTCGR